MASVPSLSRPITSKSRGICKYYATDRGCFAGRTCKFLHGQDTHTSYDRAKTCRFYAAGFCKRGAQCWFSHAKGKEKEVIEEEDDLCSICFDKPVTYGLLTGCSHIFCITCIKQWRDPADKSVDVVESGNTKRCPMCRQPAKFIIPSSKFYAQGQEAKDAALARYMDSMKRVPCKYFQKSLSRPSSTPLCPFGKDCFYQHRNPDGSEHIIKHGIDACMRLYATQRESAFAGTFPHRSDLIRSLENVFAETARMGMNTTMHGPDGSADETAVMRRLEILADQMLASLAGQGIPSDSEGETDEEDEVMGLPVELTSDGLNWPLTSMFDSDTDAEMPALASVSNSSDSEAESDDGAESESSAEEQDYSGGRMQNIRPFDLVFDPAMESHNQDASVFTRLSNLWRAGPVQDIDIPVADSSTRPTNPVAAPTIPEDEEEADDESAVPPLEPPFVTDGRGRVVWSSSSGSPAPRPSVVSGAILSEPSARAAAPVVEKPPSPRQSIGEGGFTTDGRGRVIGTTGSHENEEEEDETQGSNTDSETPAQSRSFFGRVLGALF